MLRFLIFFILITASFAGGLMLAIHYKGRGMEDTPYIADFRKRYEINPEYPDITYRYMGYGCPGSDYKLPCTKRDINRLKKQAESGDLFSRCAYYNIAPYFQIMDRNESNQNLLETARSGENNCILLVLKHPDEIDEEIISIIETSANNGSIESSRRLSSIYARSNDNKKFCRIMNNTYNKSGIEGISPIFYNEDYMWLSDKYFKYCTNIKPQELLSQDTPEISLIKGYREYSEGRYKQAADIFESIADLDNKIGYNATQCLGVMHYKGNGVDKDEKKGIEMIKESFEKGVLCEVPWVQLMPETYQYNNYGGVSSICCLDITPKKLGGNL